MILNIFIQCLVRLCNHMLLILVCTLKCNETILMGMYMFYCTLTKDDRNLEGK